MRLAIIGVLCLLGWPAISQETTENTDTRTKINGSYRINTYNGVKVWRPFPPTPTPVIVTPPPPATIVINQTAPAVEAPVALPIFGPRLHRQRQHFHQPPRLRPARGPIRR